MLEKHPKRDIKDRLGRCYKLSCDRHSKYLQNIQILEDNVENVARNFSIRYYRPDAKVLEKNRKPHGASSKKWAKKTKKFMTLIKLTDE